MALDAGMRVIAVARSSDQELLRAYGVETILDSSAAGFENSLPQVDAVLDTVGGDTVQRCSAAVKTGGATRIGGLHATSAKSRDALGVLLR
jgi:NADPH:quinone reductase-like Zn-dependent oxidoreductase